MDQTFFDFNLLVDQEIWGSEVLCDDYNAMELLDCVHQIPESAEALPQREVNLRGTFDIAQTFDMSMAATLCNLETTTTMAPTLAISEVTALNFSPPSPKAPTLAISEVTALNFSPPSPKAPTLAISEVTALNFSPSSPKALMLAISQVEVLISYEPTQSNQEDEQSRSKYQLSSADENRAVFASSTLLGEASKDSGLSSVIAASAKGLEPQMFDTITPRQSSQHAEFRQVSSPQDGVMANLSVFSTTPLSPQEAPGSNSSDPIIIDDDTDDERPKTKANTAINVPPGAAIRYKEARFSKETALRKLGPRKRSRVERKGEVQWVQHRNKVLSDLKSGFYKQESYWFEVRESPVVAMDAMFQKHDELVKEIGELYRETETISVEDVRTLRNSYIELMDHLLSASECIAVKPTLEKLRNTMDEVLENSETISGIYNYRIGDCDTNDGDYHPSKKRRQ